jgi:hypothetical protein
MNDALGLFCRAVPPMTFYDLLDPCEAFIANQYPSCDDDQRNTFLEPLVRIRFVQQHMYVFINAILCVIVYH